MFLTTGSFLFLTTDMSVLCPTTSWRFSSRESSRHSRECWELQNVTKGTPKSSFYHDTVKNTGHGIATWIWISVESFHDFKCCLLLSLRLLLNKQLRKKRSAWSASSEIPGVFTRNRTWTMYSLAMPRSGPVDGSHGAESWRGDRLAGKNVPRGCRFSSAASRRCARQWCLQNCAGMKRRAAI